MLLMFWLISLMLISQKFSCWSKCMEISLLKCSAKLFIKMILVFLIPPDYIWLYHNFTFYKNLTIKYTNNWLYVLICISLMLEGLDNFWYAFYSWYLSFGEISYHFVVGIYIQLLRLIVTGVVNFLSITSGFSSFHLLRPISFTANI